jgi:alpha-beta hydrolase superfamily lysophospholipase
MFIIGGAEEVLKKASSWNHSLLLMHGTEDRLANFSGSQEFFAKLTGDVTFKPWKGMYHEIHNEPEWLQVIRTAADWMLERV